jgi:hypothetical protein
MENDLCVNRIFNICQEQIETEAKRLLKKREGKISEGKIPGVYFDRIKFNDLADDFLADYRVK